MQSPDLLVKRNSADNEQLIPLVVLLGPTAVGKSDIAIQLAEHINGEIVSADSRLFYRGMDIGTAKPSLEDRQRVPHHLIDVADPDEVWSLAVFQQEAHKAIRSIYQRRRLPFLVGGTGQFIRSVIEGWSPPAVQPNPCLRDVLSRWADRIGPVELHEKLTLLDPPAAAAIQPLNTRRTIRALEVILTSGKRFSDLKQSGQRLYQPLLLGLTLPRPELYQRIDDRIMKMIQVGFMDEVKRLLDQGYSPELPTMSAIGYAEMVACIQGKISQEEAILLMKRRTREFVRRQANWFKTSDPQIHWFQAGPFTLSEMIDVIDRWMNFDRREKTTNYSG